MAKRDRRIDAYIAKSADFARPILTHLRAVVHEACPDVEETMKWNFPHFLHGGMLCAMAAFTQHATFGFWRGSLVVGKGAAAEKAMGQFGRITSVGDLPPRQTIVGYVKKAVAVPADLLAALTKNAKARKTFEAFSPSHRREYVEWIVGAKREGTRQRRIATAIEWMAEGKSQNWRYER